MASADVSSQLTSCSTLADNIAHNLVRLGVERATREDLIREAAAAQDEALALLEDLGQAQQVLQRLEGDWRRNFEEALAALVSRGLTAVFGERMELRVQNRVVRDVLATDLSLVMGEGASAIETKIIGAVGGSVVNVLSLLFQVLLVSGARPALRPLLLLDEPFDYLDEYSHPAGVGRLLRELAEKLGLQIILVTHSRELVEYGDVVYEITRKGTDAAKVIQLAASEG